jgi:hypothetical protein
VDIVGVHGIADLLVLGIDDFSTKDISEAVLIFEASFD